MMQSIAALSILLCILAYWVNKIRKTEDKEMKLFKLTFWAAAMTGYLIHVFSWVQTAIDNFLLCLGVGFFFIIIFIAIMVFIHALLVALGLLQIMHRIIWG